MFMLAGLLCWLRALDNGASFRRFWLLVASAVLVLLAALSKEIAVVLVLLWPAIALSRGDVTRQCSRGTLVRASVAPFVGVVLYSAMRLSALGGVKAVGGEVHLWAAAKRSYWVVAEAILGTVYPTPSSVRYLNEEFEVLPIALNIGSAVVVFGITAVLIMRVRTNMRRGMVGWLWFVLPLAPVSLIATMSWYGFGRYLYAPLSIGLLAACEVMFIALVRSKVSRGLLRALAFTLLISEVFLLSSATRNWKNVETYYHNIIVQQPERSHGYGGLGLWHVEGERYQVAIPLLQEAIKRNPMDSRYPNNLAQAFLRSRNPAAAYDTAKAASKIFPNEVKFGFILAVASTSVAADETVEHLSYV